MLAWFRHRCALFGSTVGGVIFAVAFFTMWTVGVSVFSWELADDPFRLKLHATFSRK